VDFRVTTHFGQIGPLKEVQHIKLVYA